MKHIDEDRLETDLAYRFEYLAEFMGFGPDDIVAIHGSAPGLAPLVSVLVDGVYDKLKSYDATWRHFVPRQSGFTGILPESTALLEMDHEQIQFRKAHLARYLEALVTKPYDVKMVYYLDKIGQMHTEKAGAKELYIPLVQMNALMGFVADAFNAVILNLGLDRETEIRTVRAFSKLLWIQNDLITRHYQNKVEVELTTMRLTL